MMPIQGPGVDRLSRIRDNIDVFDVRQTETFATWLAALADDMARYRIHARIDRLRLGNRGDWKSLGQGLFEMRLDHGPGYRVYMTQRGRVVIVLLCGGDKSTQAADIAKARRLQKDLDP